MNNNLAAYLQKYINPPHDILVRVAEQYQYMEDALPHVEAETGSVLHSLVLANNAQHVLELGTCLGYSAIWIGTALQQTGGHLLTIEQNEDLYWQAHQNIKDAGLETVIEIICADVVELLPFLNKKYDIIFQDTRKNLYEPLLEECIRLVRGGGLIIADDTLLAVTNRYQSIRTAIDKYNKRVFNDERLTSFLLPIGDGLTISVKR